MASILDGLGLEGFVLDGLADWPASTTRNECVFVPCKPHRYGMTALFPHHLVVLIDDIGQWVPVSRDLRISHVFSVA